MTRPDIIATARELAQRFRGRAARHDAEDRFVAENYADLKEQGWFALAVPRELGGGGADLAELCDAIRILAQGCASTALAFSMHSHLVAAQTLRHLRGEKAPLLARVAAGQLVLVSTGASDWIDSNGEATRAPGGYRVRARKVFASGAPAADLMVTSVASAHEPEGPSVLHFALPLSSEGVSVLDDWHTLGMRGTGSHTVLLEDAFVPDAAISLRRPAGRWHPVWDIVLGVAPPIYMAPYVGLAERAVELATTRRQGRANVSLIGELHTALTQAQVLWRDMVQLSGDYRFTPALAHTNAQLMRKTLVASAIERTVKLAVELAGGAAFYRTSELERTLRDVHAAPFHPLPARRQATFSGLCALGEDPSAA